MISKDKRESATQTQVLQDKEHQKAERRGPRDPRLLWEHGRQHLKPSPEARTRGVQLARDELERQTEVRCEGPCSKRMSFIFSGTTKTFKRFKARK